jgi:nitrogen-specific signal transduction histidine kinase
MNPDVITILLVEDNPGDADLLRENLAEVTSPACAMCGGLTPAPTVAAGRPFIKIRCYLESNSLILEVTDNGIGIEKDKLNIIFQSGYTTKSSGSGLGLHSVANFVSDGEAARFAYRAEGRKAEEAVYLAALELCFRYGFAMYHGRGKKTIREVFRP